MEIIGILILCGFLGAFALLLGVIWGGVAIQKRKCKCHTLEAQRQELVDAAQTISDLVDEMGVVKELQYERACKEELMALIHDLFFFRSLKEPRKEKEWIEHRSVGNNVASADEAQAIAEMYKEILQGIRPNFLEKE